jgi:hypothetical protein
MDELITRLQTISISKSVHIQRIIEQINKVAELGYNSLVYEINDKDNNELFKKIKEEFPEISIQPLENGILFDWS